MESSDDLESLLRAGFCEKPVATFSPGALTARRLNNLADEKFWGDDRLGFAVEAVASVE